MKPRAFAGLALLSFSAAVLCEPQPSALPPSQKASPAPSRWSVPVKNFDVFVDPPTGFVFVKLPQGWKFAGKVDGATLSALPPTVITSLLPAEAAEMVASDDANR